MADPRPIGIFDSGVGGLTVARAILDLVPSEPLVYVGDNGRFPYGPRPVGEIRRFALEIAGYLVGRDVKMLVVACNSIEVSAIRDVTDASGLPVVGVIDPGVRAAVGATKVGRIGMIGTEATVRSGAYDRAVAKSGARVTLESRACPAFVQFVERGDTSSEELRHHAIQYLEPLRDAGVDALILGCTHYPLLSPLISEVMGPEVVLVSSAQETAKDVYATVTANELQRADAGPPHHEFLTTGSTQEFERVARVFLGPEIRQVHAAELQPVGGGRWS